MYKLFGKRLFDITLSLLGIFLTWPIMLIVSILVRRNLGKPVIFKQTRPGKNEVLFDMFKFRTMTPDRDANGKIVPEQQRLTKFGLLLRRTSLDELPELFNILKGDMSFVGPRPLLVKYLPLYNEEQRQRHLVRPGLTGLAQVNGRNRLSWPEKFAYDVEYVANYSLLLDLKIFASTFTKVLKREGISSETSATMEPFLGNDDRLIG